MAARTPRKEPAIAADREDRVAWHEITQLFALLDGDAQGLLDEDVLAGRERLAGQRHVKAIVDGDEDEVDVGIAEQLVAIEVRTCGSKSRAHFAQQCLVSIGKGLQPNVGCLGNRVGVGVERDWSTSNDTEANGF